MQLEYSSEQQQLAELLRNWTKRAYSFEHRQRVVRSPAGVDPGDWSALAELGLTGLGIDPDDGGIGGDAVDLMIAMQEMGRALLVEPLFATLWASAVLRAADSHSALLGQVAAGEVKLACAFEEPTSRYDLAHVECRATAAGSGWRLDGEKAVVLHGVQADALIVSARTAGTCGDRQGISLFVVPGDADGLTRVDVATVDGLRAATVRLDGVLVSPTAVVGEIGAGWSALDEGCDVGAALLCAEAVGIMDALTECTLEHLRTREQFGVAIGKFQVLQHRMADVFVQLELARSMAVLAAVKCTDPDPDERRRAVSAAKARIGEALRFVGQQAVQLHGGFGVSDEMRVAHLFKRATMIELTLGDMYHHLQRFMQRRGAVAAGDGASRSAGEKVAAGSMTSARGRAPAVE